MANDAQRDYAKIERIRQDGIAELNQEVDTQQKMAGVKGGVGVSSLLTGMGFIAGAISWPVVLAAGVASGLAFAYLSGHVLIDTTKSPMTQPGFNSVRARGIQAINDNANSANNKVKAAQDESDRKAAAANQTGRREVESQKTGEAATLDSQGR